MGLIVRTNIAVPGAIILASGYNTDQDTLFNTLNGNVEDANISGSGLSESVINFSVSGHDHDGSNSAKIDLSGAGALMELETTSADHALIVVSSSSGAHAGVHASGTTATGIGLQTDHTNSSGVGALMEASAGGNPVLIRNASGISGDSALRVQHRSSTSAKAAIEVNAIAASGYGLYVTAGANAGYGIYVEDTGTLSGTFVPVRVTGTNTNAGGLVVVSSASSGTAVAAMSVSSGGYSMNILSNQSSVSGARALHVGTSGSPTGVSPSLDGWVHIDGSEIDNDTSRPILGVEGQAGLDATLVALQQDVSGTTGTSGADGWVLEVVGNGGDDDNCAFFDGRVVVAGNLVHSGSGLGFYGATATTKLTVAGARDNPEAALANLLTHLATLGLITDSTTAS